MSNDTGKAGTAIEQLAAHVATSTAAGGPGTLRDLVGLHVLDTLAAWAAGTRTREGRALIALHAKSPRDGSDNAVADAIALHCALTRLSEIDDIHLASMTTPGSIIVPAALAIAASLPDQGKGRLADAISGGYEAMTRLGLAIDGPSVLYRGIWPTYFAAPLGVAAVASRLLGLDTAKTAHAMALAMILAAPGVGHHNAATTTRWLAAGHAARNGWTAALAARAGFTSDLAVLDGAFLKGTLGLTLDLEAFLRGLGSKPILERLSFKPWCGARQTMAAVKAVKELLAEGVRPDEIRRIHARVLPPHLKMIDHGVVAGDRASHLTSLPYQIALAVHAPDAMSDIAQSPAEVPAAVRALMSNVTMEADDTLLVAGYPARWSAVVVVETPAGKRERMTSTVPGDPAQAWSRTDIDAKLARYIAPLIGPEKTHALSDAALAAVGGGGTASVVMHSMSAIAVSTG